MHESLRAWLAANIDLVFSTSTFHRIGTGHSRAMYRVTADDGRRVVVRVEQGGVFGTTSAEECRVMRDLHQAGFPVARILGSELTGEVVGQPFFVMEFITGIEETAGGESAEREAAVPDERLLDLETAASFVDMLTRLHALHGAGFGFDIVPPSPSDATRLQVQRWLDVYRSATSLANPLIIEAAAWLTFHAPPLERLSVVHGDAGPGNFVHSGGAIVGVTDWEFAHLGDPAEDFSFCLAMRGSRTMARAAWLQLFAERAGFELTDDQWLYWEAFNLFKGACANRTCLRIFEEGVNRAPNMAIIGTALHQVFLRRLAGIVHAAR